jgi:hypothetical protein
MNIYANFKSAITMRQTFIDRIMKNPNGNPTNGQGVGVSAVGSLAGMDQIAIDGTGSTPRTSRLSRFRALTRISEGFKRAARDGLRDFTGRDTPVIIAHLYARSECTSVASYEPDQCATAAADVMSLFPAADLNFGDRGETSAAISANSGSTAPMAEIEERIHRASNLSDIMMRESDLALGPLRRDPDGSGVTQDSPNDPGWYLESPIQGVAI